MRRPLLALAALLSACPAPNGSIDPGAAKADDLVGYWTHWGSDGLDGGAEPTTILAFAKNAEAGELPFEEYGLDAGAQDVAVVFEGPTWGLMDEMQLSRFSVANGAILQTVLADQRSLPGTQYSTKLYELTPKRSMTIESKRDPSGRRSYEWFDRCPVPNAAGWDDYFTLPVNCATSFSVGTSLAIDRLGTVHLTTGVSVGSAACQAVHTEIGRSCSARRFSSPQPALSDTVAAPDDMLRVAYVPLTGAQPLLLRERALRGTTWSETTVDPAPGTARDLKLFDDANGRLIVFASSENGVVLYRWNGAAWDKSRVLLANGMVAPIDPAAVKVARRGDGAVTFALDRAPFLIQSTGGAFTELPGLAQPAAAIAWDSKDRLHVLHVGTPVVQSGIPLGNRGTYALLEGSTWRTWPTPTMYGAYLVPAPDGTPRVIIGLAKANRPAFALLTLEGDAFRHELVSPAAAVGGFSTPPHVRTSAKTAPDGTIAFTFDGQTVQVRRPTGPVHRKPATFSVRFNGKTGARVRSSDGRVDCTSDCTVAVQVGERLELFSESDPGSASTLNCADVIYGGRESCFYDMREPENFATVTIVRTPVRRVQVASALNNSGGAYRFSRVGTRSAFATELNANGTFAVDGVALAPATPPTAAAHGVAVFDRATQRGWHTLVPVQPDAVAPTSDGGAYALVRVTSAQRFGNVMVGAAGVVTFARVHFDATGAPDQATTLATGPTNASVMLLGIAPAAAIDANGVTAAVLGAPTPFAGVAELTVVAHLDASGTARLVGLDATVAQQAAVVIDGGRTLAAAIVTGATKLVLLDGAAQVLGRRSLDGARLSGVSLRGARAGVMVTGTSVDLGGGARTGTVFLAEYDAALAWKADAVAPGAGATGFALLPEGGAVLFTGVQVVGLDAALRPTGTPTPFTLSGAQLIQLSQTELGLGVLAFITQPVLVDGAHTVGGFALLELVPAPP